MFVRKHSRVSRSCANLCLQINSMIECSLWQGLHLPLLLLQPRTVAAIAPVIAVSLWRQRGSGAACLIADIRDFAVCLSVCVRV